MRWFPAYNKGGQKVGPVRRFLSEQPGIKLDPRTAGCLPVEPFFGPVINTLIAGARMQRSLSYVTGAA